MEILMVEGSTLDKKAIAFLENKNPDWQELSKDCVAFANLNGGRIVIGIDDEKNSPPLSQTLSPSYLELITKRVYERTTNVFIALEIKTASNGGEYIEIYVAPSKQTVACTTDGKYYIRSSDFNKPIMPEELIRLLSDKNSFVWEEQTTKKIKVENADELKLIQFANDIRQSERVSNFVKSKTDKEILSYYLLERNGHLTNLGILWIGQREDRASLLHAPAVQFIKYDEHERKVKKLLWDDYKLNPKELLEAILTEIPDWNESIEVSDGIFRKNIHNYDKDVIRELVANALVHRSYTTRGDIFINLFHDRLEIHSPGTLPLGVTPQNIISKSIHRNTHLAKLFYDLKIMEKEGSGYDKVYEILVSHGKPIPRVDDCDDRVTVTIQKRIINTEVIRLMEKAHDQFYLKQKEVISLGIIAQHSLIPSVELGKLLNIKDDSRDLSAWIGRLVELELIQSQGRSKGTEYFINPEYLRRLGYKGKTNLKKIEPHRLKELIIEDIKLYPRSSIGEIESRIGKEIGKKKIARALVELINEDRVQKEGKLRYTKYTLSFSRRTE
ncbi:putative DNA binding domain-containing protein [Pontibacter sp. E15-1]|uniref:ATP-binding protein n=1 Tax=Pontibacter sp. E15-1 TaxID=2919918 RepID=UPI001F503C40|nr:ATP-binding protein [Pontibacter sp. E15-1]MCJ8163862.1 putative DNA binding domain-containing protein [Pontibacter sp. E15-1]